jgi:hypothetical protein
MTIAPILEPKWTAASRYVTDQQFGQEWGFVTIGASRLRERSGGACRCAGAALGESIGFLVPNKLRFLTRAAPAEEITELLAHIIEFA